MLKRWSGKRCFRYFLCGIFILAGVFHPYASKASDKGFNIGANLGLTFYLGNKTTRIGIFTGVWLYYDFVQINTGIRGYYNFRNFGPPGKYWECDSYLGGLLSWGRRDSADNPFVHNVSNQTKRKFSFGYSYNFYCDGISTSQKTGTIAIQLNRISLITENDLFGDNKDRFRTATATVQYREDHTIFGLTVLIWTGENGKKITGTNYPSRRGYKESGRFGNYSHGILCLQAQQYLDFGQNIRVDAGIDSERVRHFFQNKLMHDLFFLPSKWVKEPSYHVPMLDAGGNQYLFLPGQEIRKPTPYFNMAANPGLFY